MNEQVFTTTTSASVGSSARAYVEPVTAARMRSVSTSFLGQPSVTKATAGVLRDTALPVVRELKRDAVLLFLHESDDSLEFVSAR